MKRISLQYMILMLTLCMLVGCVGAKHNQLLWENDQLKIQITDDKYYVLEVNAKDNSIARAWEATLNISCEGKLAQDGEGMAGSIRLDSEAFSAPAEHKISGTLLKDGWQLSVSHYERNEKGEIKIHSISYLVYSTDHAQQNGLLIRILDSTKPDEDNCLLAVKGETEEQAKENFRNLWKEHYGSDFGE